jgi:hypothetical protein
MFANQRLDHHHKHVLQVTYGDDYVPNDVAIRAASLLGAYAKPALAGLVLFTLADKLRVLLLQAPDLDVSTTLALTKDLLSLRDVVAAAATDQRTFIHALIDVVRLASYIFRKGQLPPAGMVAYEPISTRPIHDAVQDVDFPKEALGRFALALALLARARNQDGWELYAGSCTAPSAGVLTVKTGSGESKVFIVRDVREALALEMAGYTHADPGSTVLIQANSEPPRVTRSPRGNYGRTGRTEMRRVNMEDLARTTFTVDELYEAFTLQGAF